MWPTLLTLWRSRRSVRVFASLQPYRKDTAVRRIFPLFLFAVLPLAFCPSARADLIYSFNTTMPGDVLGSSLSITLDASVAALPSTLLSSDNILSINSKYTSTVFPFLNFTNTNPNQLQSPATVNGLTGDITSPANLIVDGPLATMVLNFGPLNTPQDFLVGSLFGSDIVEGTWSVENTSPVPAPSSLLLAGVAGGILLAGAVRRRFHRHEAPLPTS
jgi:hypothetical protein